MRQARMSSSGTLKSRLGVILRLSEAAGTKKRPEADAVGALLQVKLDAGTGFEPVTFRL